MVAGGCVSSREFLCPNVKFSMYESNGNWNKCNWVHFKYYTERFREEKEDPYQPEGIEKFKLKHPERASMYQMDITDKINEIIECLNKLDNNG